MNWFIGQLDANGDCLYVTAIARRIKEIDPEGKVSWAVSNRCRSMLDQNPHVDEVLEFAVNSSDLEHRILGWRRMEREILRSQQYDRVILSQIWPGGFRKFDGTIRPVQFRAFEEAAGEPMPTPKDGGSPECIDPVLVLTEGELQRVDEYFAKINYLEYQHRIVFECSPLSGQSFVNPQYASEIGAQLVQELDNCCVVLSTGDELPDLPDHVYSARELTIRENKKLIENATVFAGCGSGLTVLATNVGTHLPVVQALTSEQSMFASFLHDFEYFGKDSSHILEISEASGVELFRSIVTCAREGVRQARKTFERRVPLHFDHYADLLDDWCIKKGRFIDAAESVGHTVERYGKRPDLVSFFEKMVKPFVEYDSSFNLPSGRQQWEFARSVLEI